MLTVPNLETTPRGKVRLPFQGLLPLAVSVLIFRMLSHAGFAFAGSHEGIILSGQELHLLYGISVTRIVAHA